ncbi:superoxide dismutase [Bacillus solitudinis]|uniref:superoxide dismutase n=1 Tax=Bacillus solitudinis TaxID=2014074 RepID=UPI000C246A71|nr:superoxide dismutase [Bacillus solitudinis]
MNQEKHTIKEWAFSLEQLWNEHRYHIVQEVGIEKTTPFDNHLKELQNELQKDEMRNEERISQLARNVYEVWNQLDEERLRKSDGAVPIGGHTLPPLPYKYDALEPYIAQEIMQLHHLKHHQSYVDGLNKAERQMEEARQTGEYDLLKHWEREAAFHGAGHYLHSIFWEIMSPKGGGEPVGQLATQINKDFGSFQKMKEHFSKAAEEVEGVGWAFLVWSPRSHRLEILQAEKHQNLSQQDVIPLLVLDVWEHAYYLQYKNEREPYIKNWWNVVNWPVVNQRFQKAQTIRWKPF